MRITFSQRMDSEALAQLAGLKNLPLALRYLIQKWADEAVKDLKEGLAGQYLNRRTGALARAVSRRLDLKGPTFTAEIGTNVAGKKHDVPYARIQDVGGDITPKRAGALTIPIGNTKGRAANYPNMFLLERKGKPPLLVERTAKGKLKARFVLLKRVHIPGTGWFTIPRVRQEERLKNEVLTPENILKTAKLLENR